MYFFKTNDELGCLMSNVTLKQVAQAAGVSMKTVSRVINRSPDVAERTRQRVEQVIEALNYQPNTLARSLASGKANTIGVIVHHAVQQIFHYPFFNALLGGISACLNENRLDLLLRFMDSESTYTELYDQRRVDGLIITNAPLDNPRIDELIRRNIPCVFTSRITLNENRSHWVESDFAYGLYQATRHLLDLGHERIAINAGPDNMAISHLRAEGYRKALLAHGLTIDEDLTVFGELFLEYERVEQQLLDKWLSLHHPPTAIIAGDDLGAVNIIKRLKHLGYRVPDDVSVIGVDDTPLAQIVTPQLTSVRQQAYQKGYTAADSLMKITSAAPETPLQVELDMSLIVRDSTAEPPK